MRLSRKVLMGLATIALISIFSALIYALYQRRNGPTNGLELYNTDNKPAPDGLANLPREYAGMPRDVPKIGPPLPGDLGRAILNVQREPGADTQGYAGLEDQVDNHWTRLFTAAILSSLLGVGSELGSSGNTNNQNGIVQALRRGSSDTLNQTGQQVVRRNLNIQPTRALKPSPGSFLHCLEKIETTMLKVVIDLLVTRVRVLWIDSMTSALRSFELSAAPSQNLDRWP
jgi:type IV secretory pathway VirB10-like protein